MKEANSPQAFNFQNFRNLYTFEGNHCFPASALLKKRELFPDKLSGHYAVLLECNNSENGEVKRVVKRGHSPKGRIKERIEYAKNLLPNSQIIKAFILYAENLCQHQPEWLLKELLDADNNVFERACHGANAAPGAEQNQCSKKGGGFHGKGMKMSWVLQGNQLAFVSIPVTVESTAL